MKEIIDSGRTVALPSGRNGFDGALKTRIYADWLNNMQEEIVNSIVAGGITPSNASNNQLAAAIAAVATQAAATAITGYLSTATAAATYLPLVQKGANNGVAELDGTGKVPVAQLPALFSNDHEDLDNLQGGAVGEHNHLDNAQLASVLDLLTAYTSNATSGTIQLGGGFYLNYENGLTLPNNTPTTVTWNTPFATACVFACGSAENVIYNDVTLLTTTEGEFSSSGGTTNGMVIAIGY